MNHEPANPPGARRRDATAPGNAGAPAPPTELGRDLTLLALGLVMVVEGVFLTVDVVAQGQSVLVRGAGRFALMAGLCYMTWQGFAVSRWVLVVLIAAAVAAAPVVLGAALREGHAVALLHAGGAAGYLVAGVLLAGSGKVAAFLRHRRALRNVDTL
jgi:4-amino-4-deoxy-L-arabinose transferase-like glycosyltransferase